MGYECKIWFNGSVVEYNHAQIHVMAPAVKYGVGVFEGVRGYWNQDKGKVYLFRLDEHIARLGQSVKLMRLNLEYDLDTIRQACIEAITVNGYREDCYVRVLVVADEDGPMTSKSPVAVAVVARPRARGKKWSAGATACVASWMRLPEYAAPPRIKATANYVNGRFAEMEAHDRGVDEAIIQRNDGTIAEGPGATIFLVRDGTVISPSAATGILESITRQTLIESSEQVTGRPVVERDVGRSELYCADEVFLAGTGKEICPVVSVDGLAVGDGSIGPITKAFQDHYDGLVRGTISAGEAWRTDVPSSAG